MSVYLELAERLQSGETVFHKAHGNSMTPKIKSGQTVTISPVAGPLARGDVVFCRVYGYFYIHKISAVKDGRYQVSNNHGHVNGWTSQVYGIVTAIR